MDNDSFHASINITIDKCSYKFYVVRPNKEIKCTCIDHTTKQPDVECKKCLGTGYKIIIKMMYGASNEEMKGGVTRGVKASQIIKNYFISNKYKIFVDDLIIDEDEIYYAFRIEDMKGLKGVKTHQEVMCIKKMNGHTKALQNFKDIIAKNKSKKKK